jgi:uncharacterized membrane-anchored protein YjiN (DUF445 family)
VENDQNHSLRNEITQKILDFSKDLKENPKYEADFNALKDFSSTRKSATICPRYLEFFEENFD